MVDPQHYLKFEIYLLNLCDRDVAVPSFLTFEPGWLCCVRGREERGDFVKEEPETS